MMLQPLRSHPRNATEMHDAAKARLVRALRVFSALGYGEGVAGHLRLRDPLNPDQYYVNPFKRGFGAVLLEDLLLVSSQGRVVEGTGELTSVCARHPRGAARCAARPRCFCSCAQPVRAHLVVAGAPA